MTTQYVLVCHGPNGSVSAVDIYGKFEGPPKTFATIREAVDYHDYSHISGSMSVMLIEKYEQRKIEWLIQLP